MDNIHSTQKDRPFTNPTLPEQIEATSSKHQWCHLADNLHQLSYNLNPLNLLSMWNPILLLLLNTWMSGISPKSELLEAEICAKISCWRPHRSVGQTTGTHLSEEGGQKSKKKKNTNKKHLSRFWHCTAHFYFIFTFMNLIQVGSGPPSEKTKWLK